MIAVIDSTGKIVWDKYIEVTIPAPILIGKKIIAFVGVENEACGVYFMSKKGILENVVSLSEAPVINLEPIVTPGNNILFGGMEKMEIVRIDETPLKKIIPW